MKIKANTILVTGAAGFIGYHVTKKLMSLNINVLGVDNLNNYYDVNLKNKRLSLLNDLKKEKDLKNFTFLKIDLNNKDKIDEIFSENNIDIVINLAAQAGVRYSIDNPESYIDSNIVGFMNILEACRSYKIKHLIYASSSSVYGMNEKQPFSTKDNTDYPISLYAATKKSNELLAFSYSHLYGIPTTGLRFFTVYGPLGRPDMAYFSFTKAILEGRPINVFNNGEMKRDFTYIDDIVEAILKLINITPPSLDSNITKASPNYALYNIGNNNPVTLKRFITAIEEACKKKADQIMLPMQPGDVPITFADVDDLRNAIGFSPKTEIEDGIKRFVDWYLTEYK